MIKWLKNKWLRHQDRKLLKDAFQLTRQLYNGISQENKKKLLQTLQDLIDDYHINWGVEDGVVKFYYKQLEMYK